MKFKRFIALLIAICALVFVFPACNRDGNESSSAPSAQTPDAPGKTPDGEVEIMDTIYLTINGYKIEVALEKNAAAAALAELLKQGDIPYSASDYGGFEKVGALGHTLPHSDSPITTEAGDVILYMGNNIVLFYGSNSWQYTRLGKMQGYSAEEIKNILTSANPAEVKISLA